MDAQPSVNELAFASVGRTLRQSGQCSEGGVNVGVNTGKLEWSFCQRVGLQL